MAWNIPAIEKKLDKMWDYPKRCGIICLGFVTLFILLIPKLDDYIYDHAGPSWEILFFPWQFLEVSILLLTFYLFFLGAELITHEKQP